MRELTSDKAAFVWTPEMEDEMEAIRQASATALPLRPFNRHNQSQIYTDACAQGFGFAFTQVDPQGTKYFVCVGSTLCSPTMRNYTVMELELQAVVYAVKKCSVYLLALDAFTI